MIQETSKYKQSKYVKGIEDIWQSYENKDKIPGATLKQKEKNFKNILKIFNSILLKTLIETGETIKLPKRSGYLSIRKKDHSKRKILNFHHYRETGEKLYYRNLHTDNSHVYFVYEKCGYHTLPNGGLFLFNPVKHARKTLAARLLSEPSLINKYYE